METVRDKLEMRNGWAWPKDDEICFNYLTNDEPDIPAWVMERVPGRRTIVQAGGNCGMYVHEYAKAFQRVITFEPEAKNFFCLVHNTNADNAFYYRAFLSSTGGEMPLAEDVRNGGAHFLYPDAPPGPSVLIPCMTVDSLGLNEVDLIHLDIEGFEAVALVGALQTMARCRPWVALERRDELPSRYGLTHENTQQVLTDCGYELADSYRHEELYRPKP